MKGDQADITARLQRGLPSGWFPRGPYNADGSVVRTWLTMYGFAAALTKVWDQLQYASLQTRISTSVETWLDLKAWDFFGWDVRRFTGESDERLRERIDEALLQRANTRAVITLALERLTGFVPRVIEPWDPRDVGVIDGLMFMDVDSAVVPARLVNPELRCQFFIEAILPPDLIASTGVDVPAFDAHSYADVWNGALIDLIAVESRGLIGIYALLRRLKAEGVVAWVKTGTEDVLNLEQFFTLDDPVFGVLDDPHNLLA